jgi:asparagine synthase (glutamine-hydrolysing)
MCGIAGLVDLSGQPIEARLLKAMADAIHHRGPDDEGYVLIGQRDGQFAHYTGEASPPALRSVLPDIAGAAPGASWNIGLAHRRFSIIDLSPAGHQPLFSDDDSCCVVFNGEIYNYIELRAELAQQGVRFRSKSDTEVLIEAYRAWGTDCFARFNGFWALALYDFRKRQLILSRDRLGKKPLYWTRVGNRLYFASEIKALVCVPEVAAAKKVNEQAVWHWCVDGRRDLDNETFFDGIRVLPAGSWALVDERFPAGTQTFWEVPKKRLRESDISVAEAAKRVRDALDDAVRLRLRADVPLALELSGGMDSSTVLALAARNHPERLTTYTVKYPDPRWDEEPYARAVAEHFNVDYRVLDPDLSAFWRHVTAFTRLQEEPYHSPNMQVSQVIWSHMRVDGTKVVLTGAAGDEMFGGYAAYFWKAQLENLVRGHWVQALRNVQYWTERDTGPAFLKSVLQEAVSGLGMRKLVRWVKESVPALENQYIQGIKTPTRQFHHATLSAWLREEIVNTRIPYWLLSGEKTYMGIPFEARCPFLDYRVVELATQLPATYLIRDGWHKWILRKAMEPLLPANVVWRRVKMGFPYPYERFFGTYGDVVDAILARARNPYVALGRKDRLRRDWQALSFILWYEYFINENRDLFTIVEAMVAGRERSGEPAYTPEFRRSSTAQPVALAAN